MRKRNLVFGITSTLVLVGGIWEMKEPSSSRSGGVLRVGIAYHGSASQLDPAFISTAFEYDLIQNIYGRLLRYDEKTQLVSDIPESFSWADSEVKFVFGEKVRTQSGHVVDALDAEISLKRLVIQGRSGHGDIRRFLCPGFKLESVLSDCPGIRVEGNTLVLKVSNPDFLPMLINTLESADYSIVPRSTIDLKTGKLKDTSHRNTTGPYFVAKDSEDGHLVLEPNKFHYLYRIEMPQVIEVVPTVEGGVLQGFADGKIDYLPTSAYFTGALGRSLISDKANVVHETLPVSVTLIKFSKRGIEKFSPQQRLYAGLVAGQAFIKHFGSIGGLPTEQFFQTFSDGTLDPAELEEIKALRQRALKSPPVFARPIEFGVPKSKYDLLAQELRSEPSIKIISLDTHPVNLKPDDQPEMFYSMTDSAWSENMSLIGYNFESGIFRLPEFSPDNWFQDYISVRDKDHRMKLLRSLHFDVLKFASLVPLEVAPFFSVAKAGWNLNQSKILVGTELWAIRRN